MIGVTVVMVIKMLAAMLKIIIIKIILNIILKIININFLILKSSQYKTQEPLMVESYRMRCVI